MIHLIIWGLLVLLGELDWEFSHHGWRDNQRVLILLQRRRELVLTEHNKVYVLIECGRDL